MERRSFVRNAALVGAGVLGSASLLAKSPTIDLSELSADERKMLKDYERTIRTSTVLPEREAVQRLEAVRLLERKPGKLLIATARGQKIQLQRRGDRTVTLISHQK